MSSNLLGSWDFDNRADGSIGIANVFKSLKLNRLIMALMYACCDRDMVLLARSRVILIPNNQFAGPQVCEFIFLVHIDLELVDK